MKQKAEIFKKICPHGLLVANTKIVPHAAETEPSRPKQHVNKQNRRQDRLMPNEIILF